MLGLFIAVGAAHAQVPDYLHLALARFSPNVPDGWAYTLTTSRNGQTLVERFDPTLPPGGQWSLHRFQDREPTADELEKYLQSRPTGGSGGMQANFQRADIDPGTIKLLHEDSMRAEFAAEFREQSTGADKMLSHLRLHLSVNKPLAYVESYELTLKEPYWPVLTVKMNQLRVQARFSAPTDSTPSLPESQESFFAGRILLISTQETLHLIYRDFSAAR